MDQNCKHLGAPQVNVVPCPELPSEGNYYVSAHLLVYKCNACGMYVLAKLVVKISMLDAEDIIEEYVGLAASDWDLLPDKYKKKG